MFSFLAQFKLYIIGVVILAIVSLGLWLKSSIEDNILKDMQIEALVQGTQALEELHKEEVNIAIFNTKAKLKKEEIEKNLIRNKNANQNTLNDDTIYFSL